MSLIKQNHAFGLWDFLFIGAGILSAAWFFLSYSSQDPRSAMKSKLDQKSATLKAAEVLNNFGYSTGELQTLVDFETHRGLLTNLQQEMGREESIKLLNDSTTDVVSPFYWQVLFYSLEDSDDINMGGIDDDDAIAVRLDDNGRWMALYNQASKMPVRRINREALQYAFQEDSTRELWRTVPDSAWDGVLSFDVDDGYNISALDQPEQEKDEEDAHTYSIHELKRLGDYYLNSSAWSGQSLALNDIQITTFNDTRGAVLTYEGTGSNVAQQVALMLTLTPSGSLINLESDYETGATETSTSEYMQLVTVVAIFIFGIIALFTFFFRMRARVVDTKSALVISIIGGLVVPIVIFLHNIEASGVFSNGFAWTRLIGIALQMGVFGALSSIGFFVVASIGDSITRQHWQKKLACYDYLRQGMLFNRPVGEAILRSVVLMFLVAGLWSLLLRLFPELYFNLEQTFMVYEAAWPPLYFLLDNAIFSLIIVLSIFLVVGSLVYARTKRRWTVALAIIVSVALVSPLPISFGPLVQQFAVMAIVGLVLALIYLKWDFLTLLFTHFLFINLLVVSSGWLVSSSPDMYVSITYLVLMIFLTAWAVLSIVKGKEEQSLPNYVPEYVEELAQEERIKQELQIARQVQNSFLPAQTPDLKGLDIAALCQPAYETGGDYYDFIQLDDHRIALTIGDVSGKGIQAAFYMTFTKGILHSLCRETESPAELLKKANRLFCDNARKGTFISLVYGIIDLQKKTFTFSRAGHNPILHLQGKNGKLNELQPNGLGLGLTRNASFDENIKEVQLELEEDDLLVLYTDGIVEALNETHQFYGGRRLLEQLKKQKNKTSREILDVLSEDVSSFIGSAKQHDDMTIMVIKMNNR